MICTESPYVVPTNEGANSFRVKMYGDNLGSVHSTLEWAFPESIVIKGDRGNYLIKGDDDKLYGFTVDLKSMELIVYDMSYL